MEIAGLVSHFSDLQMLQHIAVLNHERSAIVAEAVSSDGDDLKRRTVGNGKVSMRIVTTLVFALRKAVLPNSDRLQGGESADYKMIHLAEAVVCNLERLQKHESGQLEEAIGSIIAGEGGNDHFGGRWVHFGDHIRTLAGDNQRR